MSDTTADRPGRRLDLADFAAEAAARLPPAVWDFVAGASGDELVLDRNRAALDAVALIPRTLTGADVRTETLLPGGPAAMPLAIAPMAYQQLLHPEGERAVAAAARDAGIPLVVSMLSSQPIEEVAAVGAATWFQLYWLRDRAFMHDLVRRVEDSGCVALMVTLDVPVMGRRLRDQRNGFALPEEISPVNLQATGRTLAHQAARGRSAVAEHTKATFDPAAGWADLERLRERTGLPIVVKGVLDPRDAVRAAELGVDAVVVSNHGGRQLASAVAPVRMLPEVVSAVAGRCQVMLDSGIRSGTDVLRALALGASGALLGRPALWGLAVGGRAGVLEVLATVREELRTEMQLAGAATPGEAGRLRVHREP